MELDEHKRKLIKRAFWDYNFEPEYVVAVVTGTLPGEGWFDKNYFLRRMMEMLSWYDLINLFGFEFMNNSLTPELISGINLTPVKERYELYRKLLSGETVSPAGWSDENRRRLQSRVLFKRWYSPE